MFASVAITNIFGIEATTQPQINDMLARDDPPWIAGYYLLVAVAAPLREELAFRVIAFGGLTVMFTSLLNRDGAAENRNQPKIAMIMAALVSTLLFVIAHGAWAAGILPLTVLSLTLTGLYAYTGSIWPPVIFHALHNGLVVTLQFFYLSH
jgi:membrane protease YdiL (CAAX protease family)